MYPIMFKDLYWDYCWDDIDFKNVFLLFELYDAYILQGHLNDELYASKILNKLLKKLC